ncbi:MAG: hypothetical protein IJ684_02860 [Bacteroidales bacterium]|nr:hypothetical protein [Bacteroidales bacterium]
MYQTVDGILTISVNDWIAAGLSWNQFNHDSHRGYLSIAKRGIHGNTLIDVRSIRRPERLAVIEAAYGPVDGGEARSVYRAEVSQEARAYFVGYRKPDGSPLEAKLIEQYTNRASLLEALKSGLEIQKQERAKTGKRVKSGEWYEKAMGWYNEQRGKGYQCAEISNARSFERVFKAFCKDGYKSIISGRIGNDSARIVSVKMENLLLALWRTNGKPFKERVWELYVEFIDGDRELYDQESGEVFRPDDFRHKGRRQNVSKATVYAYLNNIVNQTAVYADRNGQFDYQNKMRPKHVRRVGQYSLSKISMDDVALSRKTKDGKWVYKYIAVDVLSGYWFRPSYHIGAADTALVMESFRNMFCELMELGMPMPGELEVEHHLMENIEWLNEAFPIVRFCASATEKRAEHNIRQFKYGASKDAGHTVGRWYARSEAYKGMRIKTDGNYSVAVAEKQTIIADDLEDIDRHNNELHPNQRMFPGMTRREVLMARVNPTLKPIEAWYLLRWIGNKTHTSIVNNNRLKIQQENFELADFESLGRLKANTRTVEAYWLPKEDGSIATAYLYQGDSYIGEAENMEAMRYNEFAIERTEEDERAMEHQMKRVAKFDKMIKERRASLPKVAGTTERKEKSVVDWAKIAESVETVETAQPKNYEGDEFECECALGDMADGVDYAALAYESL